MDSEQIVLEVDGSQAKREIDSTNKAVEGFGETVVRVSDRSKSSIDRLVTSMQRQADTYGKSGVDKLIAQRDSLVQRYGNEQRAVEAITRSYDQMIGVERRLLDQKRLEEEASRRASEQRRKEAEEARRAAEQESHFNLGYGIRGIKDIAEGRGTFAAAEGFNVLSGLKGAPLLIGGATAAFGALLLASKGAAQSLGEFGLEMADLKLRTGIATTDLNQFVFAAKVVGQDATIYERMMRGLSQALGENSKEGEKARDTLTRLGVDVRDKLTGEVRPTTEVLLGISRALNLIPEGFQRDAAAMDLFKRAGIEALPVIENLEANFKRANDLHLGINDEDLGRWRNLKQNLAEADQQWEKLKRHIMEPLAATWNITLKVGGRIVDLSEFTKYKPDTSKDPSFGAPIYPSKTDDHMEVDPSSKFPNLKYRVKPEYAQKVQGRADADTYIRSISSSQDPQQKLHDAEAALSKLEKPVVGVTSLADAQAYKAAEDKVTGLKNQIKYTNELTEAVKRLQSFENAMNERDLTPVQRMRQQLADFLAPKQGQAPLNAGQREAASDATAMAIYRQLNKETEELDKQITKERLQSAKQHDEFVRKEWDETYKQSADHLKDAAKVAVDNIKAARKQIQEDDKAALERYDVVAQHDGRVLSINSRREGSAGEIEAAQQAFVLRQQIRSVEMATIEDHKGAYDIDKERARVELESLKDRYAMEEKILEVKKKEFDEVEKTTEKLVNTLLTKPGSFSKELGQTIHAAVLQPITKGISNIAATAITPIVYGHDGQSGIAGAFSSAFGGGTKRNPVQVATDLNTSATIQNTAALYAHASAVYGRAAPAAGGGGGSWAPSFGGANTSSVIFGGGAPGGGWGGSTASPLGGGGAFGARPSLSVDSGGPGLIGGGAPGSFGESAGIPFGLGGAGGGSPRGGGFNLQGILSGFKGANWGGFTHATGSWTPGNGDFGGETDNPSVYTPGKINGVGGLAGGLLSAGGMMLAQRGLLGADRGTWKGVFEGTGGGAAIGLKYGGPIGAAVGAAVGLGIGLGEHFAGVLSPENKAKKLIKEIYGLSIDNAMAGQIAQLAQQKYAGKVELAVRDPDIRKMLEVYAAGTGQKLPLSASTPYGGSLAEQGGRLFQQATYQYGNPYSFQSSLPVAGGFATGQYPSGPSQVSLNINGQSAADLLEGRIANTVTPAFVQDQYGASLASSNGRIANSATLQQPGLITG